MKLYMFRTVPLSIIRSLFTVHSALVYVIQVCTQLSSETRMELLESWFYYKEICEFCYPIKSLYAKYFNVIFNYVISYTEILYTPIDYNSEIKHHILTFCLTKTIGNLTQKYNCGKYVLFWLRFGT